MKIIAYEHIGTRVCNRDRSLAFYQLLGFRVELEDDSNAIEMINDDSIRINLIVNADERFSGSNVLLDDEHKRPGHTHIAFVVDSVEDGAREANRLGIRITEGPKEAQRRRYFFIRDPDGNVLEFNELI